MTASKRDQPGLALLMKLGSIAVHAEELLGDQGHELDLEALKSLLDDEEVKSWIVGMGALLPQKRPGDSKKTTIQGRS